MPVAAETEPPRSLEDYEGWFDQVEQRFYRQELKDLAFAADIFHFFRGYKDGERGVRVNKRYGKDHKRYRVSFQLSPQDISNAQITTPEITNEHLHLLKLLSGKKGVQVTIDLRKVAKDKPFGFTIELSPAGEDGKAFASHLVNQPLVFDREVNGGESFEPETLMSLHPPYRNYGEVMKRCGSLYAFAHELPELVSFLKTTAFWILKVISRRP